MKTTFNNPPSQALYGARLMRAKQKGFTLLELAVVISIIFVILGSVTIGRDVHRNAAYQRISSNFIQGWLIAYDAYVAGTGVVPGDSVTVPTGFVAGATATDLCGVALMNAMQAAGVAMPAGRTEGANDRYVYLDTNGVPHELVVCLRNVPWSEPGATVGTYQVRNRNTLTISGMTPALAKMIDNQIDGLPDARFGQMREQSQAALTTATGVLWSQDDTTAFGAVAPTSLDESQVVELLGYVRMSR